jgi:predicted GNAT family N-acyltransferase
MLKQMPEIRIRLARDVEEIIDLRHEILRRGLPRGLAHFDGDNEPTTRHVVAEIDRRIVGCATILRRPWQGQPAYQLRGMAVGEGLQGQGIGTMLLEEIDCLVHDEGFTNQLWCNARTLAAKFYRKHGWEVASQEFHIEHAGPHVKMTKMLK